MMSGIDLFLAKSLSLKIKNNLDSNTQQKLKMKLFKKYGYSIKQSIVDFSKFNDELLEFLKSDTLKFEKYCFSEILDVEDIKKKSVIIVIKDELLIKQILEMVGDIESRSVLEQVAKKPLSIPEILVRTGFELTSKKRAVDKYTMFWEKITIEMKEGTYIVKIKISKKIFNSSSVIQTIYKSGI